MQRNYRKRIRIIGCLMIASLSFVCALCDHESTYVYSVHNGIDDDIEVSTYLSGLKANDSVKILGPGEEFTIYRDAEMGSASLTNKKDFLFIDSIVVKNLSTNARTTKSFKETSEWTYIEHDSKGSEYKLIIHEWDF